MSALKGDFISFSFNGVHSSDLGIIRTSDGSRFNENLLPTIQDKTVQVPGGDGTYFFGSFYTQKPFTIPIAFDNLKEQDIHKLYNFFGDKQIHKLIFDERPYKYYMAKITGTPQIKTICFEEKGERIYKGEGTLNFTCYYPFAKSRFKYLNEYTVESVLEWDEEFNNKDEWDLTSRMKQSSSGYDAFVSANSSSVANLFNAGDFPTDFKLIYESTDINNLIEINNSKDALRFDFSKVEEIKIEDKYIQINTSSQLIEGLNEDFKSTGNVYNVAVKDGEFFKIPQDESSLVSVGAKPTKIEYEYIYF